ncbi:hypothetical protein BTH42_29135 [Burkholderia sp. SRS-W-2-2016]|nr:hypothetical protein BTH42_29135 [Burkholderia sp. SRS-W-2-2016]
MTARRLLRLALLPALFGLSSIYVRPLHHQCSQAESRAWLFTSQALGIRDPEDLYTIVWLGIQLLVAVGFYFVITALWQHVQRCRARPCDWRS